MSLTKLQETVASLRRQPVHPYQSDFTQKGTLYARAKKFYVQDAQSHHWVRKDKAYQHKDYFNKYNAKQLPQHQAAMQKAQASAKAKTNTKAKNLKGGSRSRSQSKKRRSRSRSRSRPETPKFVDMTNHANIWMPPDTHMLNPAQSLRPAYYHQPPAHVQPDMTMQQARRVYYRRHEPEDTPGHDEKQRAFLILRSSQYEEDRNMALNMFNKIDPPSLHNK